MRVLIGLRAVCLASWPMTLGAKTSLASVGIRWSALGRVPDLWPQCTVNASAAIISTVGFDFVLPSGESGGVLNSVSHAGISLHRRIGSCMYVHVYAGEHIMLVDAPPRSPSATYNNGTPYRPARGRHAPRQAVEDRRTGLHAVVNLSDPKLTSAFFISWRCTRFRTSATPSAACRSRPW